MATLIAIAYPGQPDGATLAAQSLQGLPFSATADLDDAVAVIVDEHGKLHLRQANDLTSEGALDGALIGMVVGVVLTLPLPFLTPIALAGATLGSTAIGAITGGVIGHYRDIGIDDDFAREIAEKLPPDSSALFVLVEGDKVTQVLDDLSTCGGELLTTDLPEEAAAKLREALHKAHMAQAK